MSKIRRSRRKKVTAQQPKRFPPGRSFRIVTDMNVTPLSVMRQDAGAGSLPDIAKKIGCSRQALYGFESGQSTLGPDLVRKYAKLVGLDELTVRRLFIRSKLQFHRREAARAEAELKELPQRKRALVAVG